MDNRDDELLGADLLEELEEWDKMFDSLHVPDVPGATDLTLVTTGVTGASPGPRGDAARPDAPRPETTTKPPPSAMRPPARPTARDDDSDPFPLLEDELALNGEPRALGALLGSPGKRTGAGEEDDGLFTSAVRPGSPARPAARAPTTARRSAAIVRRPGTSAKHAWSSPAPGEARGRPGPWGDGPSFLPDDDDSGGFWPEERTHAVASELVERLAESAEALFRDAPPEVSLELDEDFYDGIEVGADAAEPAAEAPDESEPAPEPSRRRPPSRPPTGEAARRTTSHVVRRPTTSHGRATPEPLGPQESGSMPIVAEPRAARESSALPGADPRTRDTAPAPLGPSRAARESAAMPVQPDPRALDSRALRDTAPAPLGPSRAARESAAMPIQPERPSSEARPVDPRALRDTAPALPGVARSARESSAMPVVPEPRGQDPRALRDTAPAPPGPPRAARESPAMPIPPEPRRPDSRPPEPRPPDPRALRDTAPAPPTQAPRSRPWSSPITAPPPPAPWDGDEAWGAERTVEFSEDLPTDLAMFDVGPTGGEAPIDEFESDPETEAYPPTREQDGAQAAALVRATRSSRAQPVEDRELDEALDGAVAMGDGTLVRAATADLVPIDVAPDLPASPLLAVEPGIDFDAINISDVDPSTDDRTEELARDLVLYERELALVDEPGPTARLRLEAGRLAEQLGDLDRARTHYDSALQLDPRLRPPLRALRRVERALGDITEAVRHLEAEIELASAQERRALASYRADLLMAIGEQDVARVAVGDLVDDAPTDVRALLADLELAWIDGRHDELDAILDRLAQAVADRSLAGAMARARGLLAEARGGDGGPAYRGALLVDPADRLAWMGLAHAALARGDASEAGELTGHLVGQGGLGQAAPGLAGALEWRRGEALIRRGELAAAARSVARAAELLPEEPDLGELHAVLLEASGQPAGAGEALARAARHAASPGQAARMLRRAASLRATGADVAEAAALLRRAVEQDPNEPLAAIDLAGALETSGDQDGLVGLARRQVGADPDGAVFARVRLARGLERLGRADEGLAVLAAGRAAGVRSAALDAELDRAYARAGELAELAELRRQQADEKLPYLEPVAAARRAASAIEELARTSPPGPPPPPAAVLGPPLGDELEERSSHGLDGEEPDDAIPDILFAPGSRPNEAAPEGPGLPAGIWLEPSAGDALAPLPLARPAPTGLAAPDRAGEDLSLAALSAWRRLLAMDPASAPARAGAVRLAEAGPPEQRLTVLAEAQRGESHATAAIELALRRAEILVDEQGEAGRDRAIEILAEAAELDADDPRCTHALLRLLAAEGRWADAAGLLADRADALGDGDLAIAHRYRAATILLDHGTSARTDDEESSEDDRRALDLLTAVAHARPDFVIATELLRATQRRLGESTSVEPAAAPPTGERPERDDGFARMLREAEAAELQGDPGRAASHYQRALGLRPDDPLARDGFARNAERAGEAAPLAELALADLRQAESMRDGSARATAYEELARIDADLRGDLASAVLAWGAAIDADPTRMTAIRALERTYLAGGVEREPDLYDLYGRLLDALSGARDTAAMLAELARLAERTGRPDDQVLGHFRRLRVLDPQSRTALFRLEANARAAGPSRGLAELEQAVAHFFAGDARAEAAFHTRAGETLRALGDRDAAVASFRTASQILPGYTPALDGWRDTAITGGMWLEAAEACERAADAETGDRERAALYHLAGVVLMDRALDGERAIAVLRRVVEAVPGHTDGFLRLKLLYEETGQEVELVELYHQRLLVEEEPAMRVALHQGLAGLYRNFFDDREGARRHLRSALGLDPDNLRAIADLSDIAWELGDWAEAAEALIARARLETRAELLRQIFYRLGTIYADRLPDPRYAMMSFQKVLTYDPTDIAALTQVADLAARSGDHRLALGACEQLIKLTPVDADKVVHLHRVARIYLEGLQDRQKAERAYRIALDMDPTSEGALMALVGFYREVGDSISARVHLDRVAGSMRQRIAAEPSSIHSYQVLGRALEARERAGAAGSLAVARSAAEIAVLFGSTDPRDAELAGSVRTRPPLAGLASTDVDDLLFPPPAAGSLRALFRLLGDRIAKQLGLDVRRYGVGRAERLRMGSDPLASAVHEMATEMGIEEIEVYLSQRQPTVLAVEPTNPPSLVLGAQLASLDRPAELRFLVGRALKLARSSLAVPARMNVDELGALLAGILRQFSPDFTPEGIDPAQIAAEQQKLRRLIPNSMVQELAPFGLEIAGGAFDHRAVWSAIIEGGNRAGLAAAGSAAAALGAVLRLGGYRDIHQGVRDPFVAGLLRFAISEDHAALRAQLDT